MAGLPRGPLPGNKRRQRSSSGSAKLAKANVNSSVAVKRAAQKGKRGDQFGRQEARAGAAHRQASEGPRLVSAAEAEQGAELDVTMEDQSHPSLKQKKKRKSFPEDLGSSHLAQLGLDIATRAEASDKERLRKNKASEAFKREKRRLKSGGAGGSGSSKSIGMNVSGHGEDVNPQPPASAIKGMSGEDEERKVEPIPRQKILSKTATKRGLVEEQRAKARARKAARKLSSTRTPTAGDADKQQAPRAGTQSKIAGGAVSTPVLSKQRKSVTFA